MAASQAFAVYSKTSEAGNIDAEKVLMGLLDGLPGNASEVDPSNLQTEFAQVLAPGERVEKAYQLIRDMFVFTDKFNKKLSIYAVQSVLAGYVLR